MDRELALFLMVQNMQGNGRTAIITGKEHLQVLMVQNTQGNSSGVAGCQGSSHFFHDAESSR